MAMLRLRVGRQFASSAVSLMLPSNKMYRLEEKKVVNIKEFESESDSSVSVSVVGSSHGWVGMMKDRSSLSLWNPMSGSRVKLPVIPHHANCRSDVERLVIDDADCVCIHAVIVAFSQWLGVYYPGGGGCSEWSLFGRNKQYLDVVACSHRRVYSLDSSNKVARWDIRDHRRPRREWEKDLKMMKMKKMKKMKNKFPLFLHHLVYAEHTDQLFLVTRHYNWNSETGKLTIAFDVHLLVENENENENAVRYMEQSLEGLVMFVGINNAFAVAAADFPHLKPDSIYFTDQATHIPLKCDVDRIYDCGIYDYKNRTISSCYYPSQPQSHHHPPPFWLHSFNDGLDQDYYY